MAPTTMRAGYSGVLIPGSAITGTRQPGPARHLIVAVYVAEPPGRQVLTALRASLGDRRAAADAVRDAFGLCAVAVRRAIDKHRHRKRVRPARRPEDVAGEPPDRPARRAVRPAAAVDPPRRDPHPARRRIHPVQRCPDLRRRLPRSRPPRQPYRLARLAQPRRRRPRPAAAIHRRARAAARLARLPARRHRRRDRALDEIRQLAAAQPAAHHLPADPPIRTQPRPAGHDQQAEPPAARTQHLVVPALPPRRPRHPAPPPHPARPDPRLVTRNGRHRRHHLGQPDHAASLSHATASTSPHRQRGPAR
jgi:hypothetical protein